jgi:hypothetical protein
MADIYFDITGNGTAYCIPSSPTIGEEFTFKAVAYDSDCLVDLTCTDDMGYSIAIPVSTEFDMEMPNVMFITFHVVFTGETPPEPPPTEKVKRKRMPIWLYPCLRV